MNVNRILQIREGDAVKTFQNFLGEWWGRIELDAMLTPVELPDHGGVSPQVISHPEDLSKVNPFIPVMLSNSASMIEGFVRDHPRSHLAAILRPCELRALVELKKRNRVHYNPTSSGRRNENLEIISVDCPGTFSLVEYTQHAARHQHDAEIIEVELAYGRQNSYVPYQVRSACQMCDSPGPLGADIVIGTIGIEPQGSLLVIARDEETDARLRLREVTYAIATEQQVVSREVMVGKLVDKRAQKRAELIEAQARQAEDMDTTRRCLPAVPSAPTAWMPVRYTTANSAGCWASAKRARGAHPLLSELVSLSRWLASCSGCGMCQEACEHNVSLTSLVTVLSHRIQSQLHYKPGDPAQRLPWMT
ncbi:MAG: hypothetical protein HND47_16525 [Chloroflexi bacterium]|nr:hypothetical protein [Chloroflexota bacterium]